MTPRPLPKYTLQTVAPCIVIFVSIFISGSPAWGFSDIGAPNRGITLGHTLKSVFQRSEPLTLDVTDNAAPREVRCYFYLRGSNLSGTSLWFFMHMKKTAPSTYSVVLPPTIDSVETVYYFFLVVSKDLRVTITKPTLSTNIIADPVGGKPTGRETKVMTTHGVFTDMVEPANPVGFSAVGLTAMPVAPSDRFGMLYPTLYRNEHIIKAGGLDAVIRETGAKSVDYYRLEAAGKLEIVSDDQLKAAFQNNKVISKAVVNGDAVVAAMGELSEEKSNCSVRIGNSVILGGLDFTKIKATRLEGSMLPDGADKTQNETAMNHLVGKYGRNAAFRYIPCNIEISGAEIRSNGRKPSIIAQNSIFTKNLSIFSQSADDVVFDRCVFFGNIDMGDSYSGKVSFSNSVFYSPLRIFMATFYHPVRFAGLELFSTLEVGDSNFFRSFDMEDSFLKGSSGLHDNLFTGGVSLKKSVFNDVVYLNNNLMRDLFSLEHSSVKKDISFKAMDFKRGFSIKNTGIEGDGKFAGTVSRGTIILKDTTIGGQMDFSGSSLGGLEVEGSVFRGGASFYGAKLGAADVTPRGGKARQESSDVIFRDVYFGAGLDFTKTRFLSDTVFDGVRAKKDVSFKADFLQKGFVIKNSRVEGDGNFAGTVSRGTIILKNASIGGRTDFSDVSAGGLEVEGSIFRGGASFAGAKLGTNGLTPPCGGASQPAAVIFRDVSFAAGLDFTNARFSSRTIFDGVKTAKETDFSFASFPSNDCGLPGLTFRRNDFGKLKIRLYHLSNPDFFKSLQEGLRKENRADEAGAAYYMEGKTAAMKALTGEAKAGAALRAVEWLFWGAPLGYGRLPGHILFSSTVSVVFFALFYLSTGCLDGGAPPNEGRRRLLSVLNYPVRAPEASAAGIGCRGVEPAASGGASSFAADFAAALRYSFSIFFKVGRPGATTHGICRWAALCQWYAGFIATAAFVRYIAARFGF